MSRLKLLGVTTAFAAALWVVACDSDETEPNPTFMTGEAGTPVDDPGTSGKTSVGGTASDEGGAPAQTGGAPHQSGGAPAQAGSPPEALAGAGAGAGGAPEPDPEPPYDCVLHPKTHLEIINACTDAQRIEKHPTLPALPE